MKTIGNDNDNNGSGSGSSGGSNSNSNQPEGEIVSVKSVNEIEDIVKIQDDNYNIKTYLRRINDSGWVYMEAKADTAGNYQLHLQ